MKKSIALKQVLMIIDEKFDYAQDEEIIELMKKTPIAKKNEHLVEPRQFNRLLYHYAKVHNVDHYDRLIKVEGQGTKGTRYDYDDILKFLSDPQIVNRIKKVIHKKTDQGPFGLVPKCVSHQYYEMLIADNRFVVDETTGYSPYEMKLFSVPDEILFEEKAKKEKSVKELKDNLQAEQAELDCIINELRTRGL